MRSDNLFNHTCVVRYLLGEYSFTQPNSNHSTHTQLKFENFEQGWEVGIDEFNISEQIQFLKIVLYIVTGTDASVTWKREKKQNQKQGGPGVNETFG